MSAAAPAAVQVRASAAASAVARAACFMERPLKWETEAGADTSGARFASCGGESRERAPRLSPVGSARSHSTPQPHKKRTTAALILCHSGAARALCGQNPTAFAGLQTRTPQAARHGWRESIQEVFDRSKQALDSGFHRR